MNVLLVDDEHELVSAMAQRLSFRGIDADWTTSPDEAGRLLGEKNYDAVVLDMRMPGACGLDVMSKLIGMRPDIKVIFLTGHACEESFRKGCAQAPVFISSSP